jgi:hypothetical protein
MNNIQYLIIGVEDGWIAVDNDTWRLYQIAKELINKC